MRTPLASSLILATILSSAKAPAQDGDAVLQNTPAGHGNILVFGDLLPVVQRALKAKKLAGVCKRLSEMTGSDINPRTLRAQINTFSEMVPNGVVLTSSDHVLTAFGSALRSVMGMMLIAELAAGDEATFAKSVPKLRKDVYPVLEALRSMQFSVFVGTRRGAVAEQWFRAITRQVPIGQPPANLKVENDVLSMNAKLQDLLTPDTVAAFLEDSAFVTGPEDTFVDDINKAIAKVVFRARLELLDEGLLFSFGDIGQAKVDPKSLGQLWQSERAPLLFGKWAIASLRREIDAFAKMWDQWKNTTAGKRAKRNDPDDFLGTITDLKSVFDRMPLNGAVRMDADDALRIEMLEDRVPAADLASGVARLVPDTGLVVMSGLMSAPESIGDGIRRVEDRVAMKSAQAEFGRTLSAADAQLVRFFEQYYYGQFKKTRDVLLRGSLSYFDRGYAIVGDGKGKVSRLPGAGELEAPVQVPEFAMIGKLAKGKSGFEFFTGLMQQAARDSGATPPADPAAYRKDLGLGVPTLVVPFPVEGADYKGAFGLGPGAVLHGIELDGFFVASTSCRLTKAIMAAHNGQGRFALNGATPVARMHATGKLQAMYVRQAFDIFGRYIGPAMPADGMGDVFAAAVELIDRIESTTVISGNRLRTKAAVRF